MLLADPFSTLFNLQRALEEYYESPWLDNEPGGGGAYPPLNVFRKEDDFIVIAELPGVSKSDLTIEVKDNAVRIAGSKAVKYPEKSSVHRRERAGGAFDRTVALPVSIDTDRVKAECRDGMLALFLPRSERDKPKTIAVA
jgi:HSP20 family protein